MDQSHKQCVITPGNFTIGSMEIAAIVYGARMIFKTPGADTAEVSNEDGSGKLIVSTGFEFVPLRARSGMRFTALFKSDTGEEVKIHCIIWVKDLRGPIESDLVLMGEWMSMPMTDWLDDLIPTAYLS